MSNNPGQETTNNNAIRELKDSVIKLNKSTQISNIVMITLTIILVILTFVLIFQNN